MYELNCYHYLYILFFSRDSELLRLNALTGDIKSIYLWVVFGIGFPGNIFCILTVLTMQQMTTATFFVSLLAFYDACTLTVKLVYHQLGKHQVYLGSMGCKMAFLSNFFSAQANWVLVFICAERFVAVCFPLKKAYIVTKRRSYVCSAVMFIALLIPFALLYVFMRDSDPSGRHCGTFEEYVQFWIHGWYWINSFIYLFIPLFCIVILTAFIIRGLTRSRVDRRSIMRTSSKGEHGNRRLMVEVERLERSITVMLIMAALIFTILLLPSCVFLLAFTDSENPLVRARWRLFDQIQYVFSDSSHAVNFFLYFFSAQRFRNQFLCLLTCRTRRLTNQRHRCTESGVTKYSIALSRGEET